MYPSELQSLNILTPYLWGFRGIYCLNTVSPVSTSFLSDESELDDDEDESLA